tara:strand:- start:115 stop:369 length:255 start_codon:yes stop_codon:yes gene_type:complete
MIIPIRCFTCGKILGDKWEYYQEEVLRKKMSDKTIKDKMSVSVIDVNADEVRKTPEGEVMDEIGLIRYCCRKTMLGHINLVEDI